MKEMPNIATANLNSINRNFVYEFLFQVCIASNKKEKLAKIKEEEKKPKLEKLKALPFIRQFAGAQTQELMQTIQTVKPQPITLTQAVVEKPEKQAEEIGKLNLEKIEQLIKDSSVKTIECSGQNKTIIIRKDNEEIEAPSLTEEEIKDIIKEIAEKTNTQLSTTFKAKINGFVMNAILSDFIGSSFVIAKE